MAKNKSPQLDSEAVSTIPAILVDLKSKRKKSPQVMAIKVPPGMWGWLKETAILMNRNLGARVVTPEMVAYEMLRNIYHTGRGLK